MSFILLVTIKLVFIKKQNSRETFKRALIYNEDRVNFTITKQNNRSDQNKVKRKRQQQQQALKVDVLTIRLRVVHVYLQ